MTRSFLREDLLGADALRRAVPALREARGVTLAPAEQDAAKPAPSGDMRVGCFFLHQEHRGGEMPTR